MSPSPTTAAALTCGVTLSPATAALTRGVTVAHASVALGVSRDTIRRMINRGELYAERLGPRLIRVDLTSIRTRPLTPAHSGGVQ